MLVVAILAETIAPYSVTKMDLRNRLSAPGDAAHWLGTDELGRDVLSRLIFSIRISLLIAFGATAISAIVGTLLGFLAAHFRGLAEQAVLMLADFQASMPFLILALAVLAFFGSSLPLLIGLMGFYGWERYARIARGLAISATGQGYASAVRQLGATPPRIYLRHILPNIASTLIISMTLVFPEVILLESGLSFLGLGVQPVEGVDVHVFHLLGPEFKGSRCYFVRCDRSKGSCGRSCRLRCRRIRDGFVVDAPCIASVLQ